MSARASIYRVMSVGGFVQEHDLSHSQGAQVHPGPQGHGSGVFGAAIFFV